MFSHAPGENITQEKLEKQHSFLSLKERRESKGERRGRDRERQKEKREGAREG